MIDLARCPSRRAGEGPRGCSAREAVDVLPAELLGPGAGAVRGDRRSDRARPVDRPIRPAQGRGAAGAVRGDAGRTARLHGAGPRVRAQPRGRALRGPAGGRRGRRPTPSAPRTCGRRPCPNRYGPSRSTLLRQFTDTSIRISERFPGSAAEEEAVAESGQIERRLWALAGQALHAEPTGSAARLYVESLNEMFDAQSSRVYGLSNRVPTSVLVSRWSAPRSRSGCWPCT